MKRAELAASVQRQTGRGADAGIALGDLLRGWPKDVPSKPQAIAVTPTSATVSVAVEGDASPFLHHQGPRGLGDGRTAFERGRQHHAADAEFQAANGKNGATP